MAKHTVVIDQERCKGCHLCIHVCNFNVLRRNETVNTHGYFTAIADDPSACRGCGNCFLICPDMAIEIYSDSEKDMHTS